MTDETTRFMARYVRPIYEAIDNRQYKVAMKLCMHKRVVHLDIVHVLKAHCLERTGRVEEALDICRRIQRKQPTDETLLNTMNLVFKLGNCEHEMLPTFEHACTVSTPPNEELYQSLFMSYVRRGDFLKQQQTALKMFKAFGNMKYVCWAALSMMLQVELANTPVRMLALAEKMLLKTLRDSRSDNGEVLQLTVLIMQLQNNHQGALDAFDEFVTIDDDKDEKTTTKMGPTRAAEGEGTYEEDIELGPMQAIDRLSLEATLAKNVANWTRCAAVNRKLLEGYNADDWTVLKEYIAARFKAKTDCTSVELLSLEKEMMEFMNELQSRPNNERLRGPALALIHISAETLRCLKPGDATAMQVETKLQELILAYVDRFYSKACCFTDLKQYFTIYLEGSTLVSAPAKSNLIQHFSKLSMESASLLKIKPIDDNVNEKTHKVGQSNLSKRLLALKTLRFLGYYENAKLFSVDSLNHVVEELEEEYEATNWLIMGSAGGQREVQLTDDLLLLATHFLLDIYQRSSGHREYLERAAGLLEYGLEKSAYNFQMKLLLSRVYGYLGAAEAMVSRHMELDVKYVQLDSLSFLVLDKMLDLCQYPEAQKLTNKIAALHRNTSNDTPEYIARAYRLGVYSKVVDMSLFLHKRMKKSHTLAISRGEMLRFQLLDSMVAGPAKLHEFLTSPSLDAQLVELQSMLVADGTELSHNQHREVIVDWTSQQQVPTGDFFAQNNAPVVECDRSANASSSLLWLRLRVLVPNLLKSLAEDQHSNLASLTKEYMDIVAQLHCPDSASECQSHVKLWEWSSNVISASTQIVNAVNGQIDEKDDHKDIDTAIGLLQDEFTTIMELLRAKLVFTCATSCETVALSPYAVSMLSSLLLDSGLTSLSALALAQRALGKKKGKKNDQLSDTSSAVRNLLKHMHELLMELGTYIDELQFTSRHMSQVVTSSKSVAQQKAYTNMETSYRSLQIKLVELLGVSNASVILPSATSASNGSILTAGGSTIHGNVNMRLDMNASAFTVDATSSIAVLAGRKGLHVLDLDAPFLPPATLHHQTKLEVTVVKCNPHTLFKSHVASSSNRNTLIWDVKDVGVGPGAMSAIGTGQGSSSAYERGQSNGGKASGGSGPQMTSQPLVTTLRAHSRPVSDVAWSIMEPALLATCSADAKTLLWDMRSAQRPVQTLDAFNTSVVQVEWNRIDATSLATAHDGEVRIWDLRTAAERTVAPVALITAHMQKIYGLDWHPQRMYELVTCSEDRTVKFWDVTQPRVCKGTLNTGAPVWRAHYTPFGDGLVTISQRLDNMIRLWALSHDDGENQGNVDGGDIDVSCANAAASVTTELVHTFVGHSDLVRGMAWRVRPQTSVYQLISWSKDQELRMWDVDVRQLEACGYDTTSYLADGAPYVINDASARQDAESRRVMHAGFDEMHVQHSEYTLSALKTDFVPLVVPKSAVPLNMSEYTLEGNDSSLQALLALEEEIIEGGKTHPQQERAEDEMPRTGGSDDAHSDDSVSTKERCAISNGARALPCPRISGAAFSGPNMLLVFDSRVAIGQSRSSAVTTAVAAGKESKLQVTPNKLPRTYEELLDLRDSRLATKKNKKPPVKLLSSANIMGAMDVGSTDWTGQQQSQELLDSGVLVGVYCEEMDIHARSTHGYCHSSMYYSSGTGGPGRNDDILSGVNERKLSIHEGPEYLNTYFAGTEYHVPVNSPDQRLSMLSSAVAGLQLSPRVSVRPSTAERLKRVEQAAPALNLDLSISVTILDLSKLCGVSAILMYQTDLVPRGVTPSALSPKASIASRRKKIQLGSVNRSMLSWMLRAAEDRFGRRGVTPRNNLNRVLKGLLNETDASVRGIKDDNDISFDEPCTALAATCAQNACTAMLAGRHDLQQIWSLLEISAAPEVKLPIYKKNNKLSTSISLQTSHPWSAHPLGKRLVHKILDMYEQAGDVQALASIVCVLKPSERKVQNEMHEMVAASAIPMEDQLPVVREDRRSSIDEVRPSNSGNNPASVASGIRCRRSSSNTLTQLVANRADSNDAPPIMKGARRSSSHSDARLQRLSIDKDTAFLRASKDWLLASSSNNSATSSRHSSPIQERTLTSSSSGLSTINRDALYKASAPASHTGWKIDFNRMEYPSKTWSGNSNKDAPPPRLTADTFQRPTLAGTEKKSPAPSMKVTASPRTNPLSFSPLDVASSPSYREEEVNANDRVLLQLSFRSVDDEKCLLSSRAEDEARYDIYKEAYASVLYRYGAMSLRNEVLKTKSHGTQDLRGISMGLICTSCHAKTSDAVCTSCREFAIRCSVCQLVVRGQSMFCLTCGHGGHAVHLREWFGLEQMCPTGCGCWCKQATATMPAYQLEQQETDETVLTLSRSHSF